MGSRPDPAGLRPRKKRDGADFWPTIDTGIHALLVRRVLPALPPEATIWEFAAGRGDLADVTTLAGRIVIASDLLPQGAGIFRHDFVHDDPPPSTRGCIGLTNPPNSQLDAFIARGLALIDRGWLAGMVLLLRIDHDMAACRAYALNRAAEEWLCCWRPLWIAGTAENGRWTNFFVLWRAGHPGPPVRHRVTLDELEQPRLGGL